MADHSSEQEANKARASPSKSVKSVSKVTKGKSVYNETQEKSKLVRWNCEKVSNLLICLQDYKTKLAYQGLDFDADRPLQYRMLRKEMAKIYESEDPLLFGPIEICTSDVSMDKLSKEGKEAFHAKKRKVNDVISWGHARIQENVKEIRQSFSKAVTAGTRSGSGKILDEFYDDLFMIWGGSPSSEPLSFGVGSSSFSESDIPNGQDRDDEIIDYVEKTNQHQQQRIPEVPGTSAGQGSIPQHQMVHGERAAFFRRTATRTVTQTFPTRSLTASFTLARSYHNQNMNIRPSTSRSTDRTRSRSSHVSQPYFRRHTNAFGRGNGKKEVIKVPKDVFLFDTGMNIVPRGTKQAPLYENKQVLSSLKIDPNRTEA
eukprot:Seg225.5 transcript_id=Seg225.5/GoldUCD/mRNA.D3Y31 product="hypothetical protein" protein_id=Seg225.5/GoldUCD/D3Y31